MIFNLSRLRRSRLAHALSLGAMLSLVFLLHPYCETADATEADTGPHADAHHGGNPGNPQPSGTDTCPSLDHTPVVLPNVITPATGNAAAKIPPARLTQPGVRVGLASWPIVPRATPPPVPLPVYLRYAHLLF